ncbi:MAG: hypoxanthine phosphoribosyltransferase [Mycoplasmatales bacterium]
MKNDKFLKEVLVSCERINEICVKMGKEITKDYSKNKTPPLFIGLLKGCHPFMSDLLKEIDLTLEIDYMDVSSYLGGTKSTGDVQIIRDMTISVQDRDIIIVEDIVDSGRTIKKISDLLNFRGANSIEIATLIDKPSGRTVDLVPKYIGTEIPSAFIIGYGLDYKELYRNLDCIGIPKDELIKGNDEEEK